MSNAYAQEINRAKLPWPQPPISPPASSPGSPPVSTPASGLGSPPAAPPPSSFKAKCSCPVDRCTCNVEQLATKLQKRLFGDSLNTAIAVVAQFKEISTLAAAAPGMRQAAGCVLVALETIGAMADNVAAFDQLASQSLDNFLLILTCKEIIDDASPAAGKAKAALDDVASEFAEVMKHITETMLGLNRRGKIRRYIFAKADKNDLDKHRSAMAHMINKLQVVLQLANLAKKDGGGGGNQKVKQLTEQDVHKTAERYKNMLVQRAEEEYNRQVTEYYNSPQINLNASANFNAGENSNVYKSGNVSTKIISGITDRSTNTNTVTIMGGNYRGGGDYRPRGRRSRGGSDSEDSEDSDEYHSPRARREERQRRGFERGYRDEGRR